MSPHPASRPNGFFCWGFGPRSSSLTPGEPRLRPRLGQMLGTVGWREVLVTQPCLHSEYISWNGGSVYLLLSNLRIDTHHHHKIVGTSVPFPVGCLLSQLRISTNELLNHLAGWRLLCICDLCRLIFCVNRVQPTVFIVTQQYSLSLHGMKIACRLYNACSIVHNPD